MCVGVCVIGGVDTRFWTWVESFAEDKTKREPEERLDGGADVGDYFSPSFDSNPTCWKPDMVPK